MVNAQLRRKLMISLLSVTKSVSQHSLVFSLENSFKIYMSNKWFYTDLCIDILYMYNIELRLCEMRNCITLACVQTRNSLVLILCLSIVDHPLSIKYTYLACQKSASIVLCLLLLLNYSIKAQVIVLLKLRVHQVNSLFQKLRMNLMTPK